MNGNYLEEFGEYLNNEKISYKTKMKHFENVEFFLVDYLQYRLDMTAVEGIDHVDGFLGYFFINKCMWSSRTSVKENITSIKKFYKFMLENNYINKASHKVMLDCIKENKEQWMKAADGYDDFDDEYEDDMIDDEEFDNLVIENYYYDLKDVYTFIKTLIEIKPWDWISNDQLFSAREPVFFENFFFSFLGHEGGEKAIMLHSDYDGLKGFIDTYTKDALAPEEFRMGMNGYIIHLFDEKYMDDANKTYIAQSKVEFIDNTLMPKIYEYKTGKVPKIIEPSEIFEIAEVLERVVNTVKVIKEKEQEVLNLEFGQVFGLVGDELSISSFSELENDLFKNSQIISMDDLSIKKILKSCKKTKDEWAIESFYHPHIMDAYVERPYHPTVVSLADQRNHDFISFEVISELEVREEILNYLFDNMTQLKTIPSVIHVPNMKMFNLLLGISEQFDIKIEPMKNCEILDMFKLDYFESL